MAERVVIAQLVIDETGVVRAIQQTKEQVDGLGKQTKTTADVFTARMFNMRSAAVAFLGVFTAAGVVYGLRNLAAEALKANTAFAPMASSWERFSTSLKLSLSYMPGVTGALNAMGAAAAKPERTIAGIVGALNNLSPKAMTALLIIGRALDAAAPGSQTGGASAESRPWERLGFLDVPAKPGAKRQTVEAFRDMGIVDEWERALALVDQANEMWATNPIYDFLIPDDDAMRRWEDSLSLADEQSAAWERMGLAILASKKSFDTMWDTDKFNALAGALQSVGFALSEMIATGGNARELFSGVLRSLSAAMFIKSAEYVAYAIAASTGIGAATLAGTPTQFLRAAAKFAAVGAIAGVAARASGGGGGQAAGFSQSTPLAGSQPVAPQVTIILEGTLSDARVRDITGGVLKSIQDGVSGGQLAVVGA